VTTKVRFDRTFSRINFMRRRQPTVSVLMASFNHAPFVAEAITSVLSQSLTNIELIVVDDASNDRTAEIVASICDERLKLICQPFNRGVHVRNLALSLARGHYIAFQNSDDVWQLDKLARQLEVMEANDNLTACFTGVALIDVDGNAKKNSWGDNLFTVENRLPRAWLRHFFDVGNCLALPSAMVRRADLVKLGGFRGSLVQLPDFDLWIRLAALGDFMVLPVQLTKMRIVDGVNLSEPSAGKILRMKIEHATVLQRFTEPELLTYFPISFPDLVDFGNAGARKVALALRAMERFGTTGIMFADCVIANVLDEERARADAIKAHGLAFAQDFFERRCQMELLITKTK
jgi:glycosyltransferase involved in cell wall biosynthesis